MSQGSATKFVCLYHGIDLDGYCSGAIYRKAHENAEHELIPMNYGWDVPWDKLEGADVTLIDFCLQPWDQMEKLISIASHVTLIDHHKSTFVEVTSRSRNIGAKWDRFKPIIDITFAGCELAWKHYFPKIAIPEAVRLLGRYDVWDHAYSDKVMPFQYGMRLEDLRPDVGSDRWLWHSLLSNDVVPPDTRMVNDIVRTGADILRYQQKEDMIGAKSSCFEIQWNGGTWLAANRMGRGSSFFTSLWDSTKYAGMIAFGWNGVEWRVGLYAEDPTVDCSVIAKSFGGGGHAGAAGFSCTTLPFGIYEGKKPEKKECPDASCKCTCCKKK